MWKSRPLDVLLSKHRSKKQMLSKLESPLSSNLPMLKGVSISVSVKSGPGVGQWVSHTGKVGGVPGVSSQISSTARDRARDLDESDRLLEVARELQEYDRGYRETIELLYRAIPQLTFIELSFSSKIAAVTGYNDSLTVQWNPEQAAEKWFQRALELTL